MIIIPNVEKEDSCLNCPIWSLCWDSEPTEDISKDRCPITKPKDSNAIEKIKLIISIPNTVIQEDVLKYKMICDVIARMDEVEE